MNTDSAKGEHMKGLMQNINFMPSSIPAETMYGLMNLFKRVESFWQSGSMSIYYLFHQLCPHNVQGATLIQWLITAYIFCNIYSSFVVCTAFVN